MSALANLRSLLQSAPSLQGVIAWESWVADQEARGEKVELYRDYADGNHRASLTRQMKAMLRLPPTLEDSAPFNLNHCENVISTMADRLELTEIRADNDAATEWGQDLLQANRIDGFQLGVHDSALRDADTYLMVSFNNDTRRAEFSHEPAWDGAQGMLVVYPDRMARRPAVAIKVWAMDVDEDGKVVSRSRVNLYFPDRIEKYVERGGQLERFETPGEDWPAPWRSPNGEPLGVPIVHFSNRGVRYTQFGKSELDDALPIQDAINRTLVSMVMASELTAFQIRTAKGFDPPADLTPGMWVTILLKDANGKPVTELSEEMARFLEAASVDALKQGELSPFIEQEKFLIEQLYTITKTPMPGMGSDSASGESLKQREVGLIGKCKRAQVHFGNAWEDTLMLAHRIESAYAVQKPPAFSRFYAKWRSAEIRDESKLVEDAERIADRIDQETFLEIVASRFDWDAETIKKILKRTQAEQQQANANAFAGLPGFGNGADPERLFSFANGANQGVLT